MFEYQKYNQYFAQVAGQMEQLCEDELRDLGATNTRTVYRGVRFSADRGTLYRINYQSRLTTRVLARLLTFSCHSAKYLKKTVGNIPWEEFLDLEKTFAVNASVSGSKIDHSLYAALCVKDGIADYFNARFGKRPNVDTENPDVRIHLHLQKNRAAVSLDTSGYALHKRGYRKATVVAPVQETLAAALIRLSGWDGQTPLWDCMCGSGTILCEALMSYCRIPAQYFHSRFGFQHLPDFDPEIWNQEKQTADSQIRSAPLGLLRGSDKSGKTIAAARENLTVLPGGDNVELSVGQFQEKPSFENGTIITNPPYGIRLGDRKSTIGLYKQLGDFIKKKCLGTTAYVLVGDRTLSKSIGLKPSRRWPLRNGDLDSELVRIESYRIPFRGSQKADSL